MWFMPNFTRYGWVNCRKTHARTRKKGGTQVTDCFICKSQYWEHTESDLSKCLRQANLRLQELHVIVEKLKVLYWKGKYGPVLIVRKNLIMSPWPVINAIVHYLRLTRLRNLRFNLLISDCDIKGVPVGAVCSNCGKFIGRQKLKTHQLKCGRRHWGVHNKWILKLILFQY